MLLRAIHCTVVILIFYLFFWFIAAHLANKLMFHPQRLETPAVPTPITIEVGENKTPIVAQHYKVKDPKATLLYSHGNAEELATMVHVMESYRAHGYSVVVYDYQGYGDSEGQPSETNLYADIRAVYRYMRDTLHLPAKEIILYGRSIGSGPSVQLATEEKFKGLVLEGAFMSIVRTVTRWPIIPADYFVNLSKINHIHCPVLFVHGQRDHIVPFYHGEALYERAREPKQHLWLEDAGHNDVLAVGSSAYWKALDAFVKGK